MSPTPESPTLEFLTVAFMFVVRVAVPLALAFGVLYLFKRWLEPNGDGASRHHVSIVVPPMIVSLASFVAIVVIGVVAYTMVTNQFINLLMLFRGIAVVLYLFVLRIGVPFILIIGIGAWLERKLNPDAARESKPLSERIPALARFRMPRFSARGVLAITLVATLWSAGIGMTIARFFFGLGYVTNMTDEFPWGIWIGFDMISGVALAAGGFVIAGTVYVFNIERFHPIVRPAVLTALLGYLLAIMGLLFDLGRWYNIWHPIFGFWNVHSVLLEVAWCVVLYTVVLALEFSPVIFEKLKLQWPLRIMRAITIPLVILGMCLSTLHQSSLGSLFLIFPEKINPLWYSPLLPVFFFISAIAVGLGMVMVESNLSARAFHRELENHLMRDLGLAAAVALLIYFVLKVYDLIARGATAYLTVPGFHSMMYWIEMFFGVLVPMLILASRRGRENPRASFASAILIVVGVVLNRLNTALLGWWAYAGTGPIYIPSLGELTVTFSLIAAGVVAFGLAVKFLPVFPKGERAHA
jgi:Ni/Fe-hydrogenase subunit HybB-like protein